MTPERAMVVTVEMAEKMDECAQIATLAAARYDAHMSLYNIAARQGDMKEMETQRLVVHAQVDALLDAGFELHAWKRKIDDIHRSLMK